MNTSGQKPTNAFEAIMHTNQKKLPIIKKTQSSKPKDSKNLKQADIAGFVFSNRSQNEGSNPFMYSFSQNENNSGIFLNSSSAKKNTLDKLDETQNSILELSSNAAPNDENQQQNTTISIGNMQIVLRPGYSNFLLNPAVNSGLEHNLTVNSDTIKHWFYTLGKSFRQYQFNIVKTCLSSNTLVALPTGLGKTFVAATVMLNYYLWFPKGKIFFLAPTRPLVNQQIECIRHLGVINPDDIFEMTGNYPIPKRKEVYNKCRIFFQTPQTLENDLMEARYDGQNLCLVVFDEAHRGTGNYAYVNIMKCFEGLGRGYRVLALSATPGNEFESIQEVLNNLCISKLEIKDEEDYEVKQYIHSKEILPIKIQATTSINQILQLLGHLLNIQYQYFKNKKLLPIQYYKIVKTPNDIGQGLHFSIRTLLQQKRQEIIDEIGFVGLADAYDNLATLNQLLQGKKKISEQSVNNFKDWLHSFMVEKNNDKGKPIRSKAKILEIQEFKELWKLTRMDEYTVSQGQQKKMEKKKSKSNESAKSLSREKDEKVEEGDDNGRSSAKTMNSKRSTKSSKMEDSNDCEQIEEVRDVETHPKSTKLVELLKAYYSDTKNIANESKTIVFTQGRNSATELNRLLNQNQEKDSLDQKLFRSEIFIGQANLDGNGMNQKQQIETIQYFKSHVYNILIATCIGEEGLDIGEVDLIICYDSGFSPIRMIQRMGRTGRKRAGKVYVLLMEGKEYGSYVQSQKKHKELIQLLKNNSFGRDTNQQGSDKKIRGRMTKMTKKQFVFYGFNPRMIPTDVNPSCRLIQSVDQGNYNLETGSVQSDDGGREQIGLSDGDMEKKDGKKNKDKKVNNEKKKQSQKGERKKKQQQNNKKKQCDFIEEEARGEALEEEEMSIDEESLEEDKQFINDDEEDEEEEEKICRKRKDKNIRGRKKQQMKMKMEIEEEEEIEEIEGLEDVEQQQVKHKPSGNSKRVSKSKPKKKSTMEEETVIKDSDKEDEFVPKKKAAPKAKNNNNKKKKTIIDSQEDFQGVCKIERPEKFKDLFQFQDELKGKQSASNNQESSIELNEEERKSVKRQEAEERVKELAFSVNRKSKPPPTGKTSGNSNQLNNIATLKSISELQAQSSSIPPRREHQYSSSVFDQTINRSQIPQIKIQQDPTIQPFSNNNENSNRVQIKSNLKKDVTFGVTNSNNFQQNFEHQQLLLSLSSSSSSSLQSVIIPPEFTSNKQVFQAQQNQYYNEDNEEVVFLKKLNPSAVFNTLEQDKLQLMMRSSKLNSSYSSDLVSDSPRQFDSAKKQKLEFLKELAVADQERNQMMKKMNNSVQNLNKQQNQLHTTISSDSSSMVMIMNQSNGKQNNKNNNNYTSVLSKAIDCIDNDNEDSDSNEEEDDSEEDPEIVRQALNALPIITEMQNRQNSNSNSFPIGKDQQIEEKLNQEKRNQHGNVLIEKRQEFSDIVMINPKDNSNGMEQLRITQRQDNLSTKQQQPTPIVQLPPLISQNSSYSQAPFVASIPYKVQQYPQTNNNLVVQQKHQLPIRQSVENNKITKQLFAEEISDSDSNEDIETLKKTYSKLASVNQPQQGSLSNCSSTTTRREGQQEQLQQCQNIPSGNMEIEKEHKIINTSQSNGINQSLQKAMQDQQVQGIKNQVLHGNNFNGIQKQPPQSNLNSSVQSSKKIRHTENITISNSKNSDSDQDSDEDEDAIMYLKSLQLGQLKMKTNENTISSGNSNDLMQNNLGKTLNGEQQQQYVSSFSGIKHIIQDKQKSLVSDADCRLVVQMQTKNGFNGEKGNFNQQVIGDGRQLMYKQNIGFPLGVVNKRQNEVQKKDQLLYLGNSKTFNQLDSEQTVQKQQLQQLNQVLGNNKKENPRDSGNGNTNVICYPIAKSPIVLPPSSSSLSSSQSESQKQQQQQKSQQPQINSSKSSQVLSGGVSQTSSQSSLVPQKKKAYELLNEKLKRDMESEFDQEEWDQRNKSKPIEIPKLDPKAKNKQKKDNKSKEEQKSFIEVVNQIGVLEEKQQKEKNVVGQEQLKQSLLYKQSTNGINYNISEIQPSIQNDQLQQQQVTSNNSGLQNEKNAFKDIFSFIDENDKDDNDDKDDDSDEDIEELGFIQNMSKTFQKVKDSQQQQVMKISTPDIKDIQQEQPTQLNSKYKNSTFRKNNPYIGGDRYSNNNNSNQITTPQYDLNQFAAKKLLYKK